MGQGHKNFQGRLKLLQNYVTECVVAIRRFLRHLFAKKMERSPLQCARLKVEVRKHGQSLKAFHLPATSLSPPDNAVHHVFRRLLLVPSRVMSISLKQCSGEGLSGVSAGSVLGATNTYRRPVPAPSLSRPVPSCPVQSHSIPSLRHDGPTPIPITCTYTTVR